MVAGCFRLVRGGLVEVRPMRDGKNRIVLTPKPAKRRGAVGLFELFTLDKNQREAPELLNAKFVYCLGEMGLRRKNGQ